MNDDTLTKLLPWGPPSWKICPWHAPRIPRYFAKFRGSCWPNGHLRGISRNFARNVMAERTPSSVRLGIIGNCGIAPRTSVVLCKYVSHYKEEAREIRRMPGGDDGRTPACLPVSPLSLAIFPESRASRHSAEFGACSITVDEHMTSLKI